MSRPKNSDHFNGQRFFNPHHPHQHGLWQLLRMLARWKPTPWPAKVENQISLRLEEPLSPGRVAVTFVNHATLLIQLPGLNILTDPVWSKRVSPFRGIGPKRVREPGIPFQHLPRIDLVLISHNHYDHLDIRTLKALQRQFAPQFLVSFGDAPLLHEHGLDRVRQMDWWDSFQLKAPNAEDLEIIYTPTQHFSSRGLFDRNRSLWGGFVIRKNGYQIYFGGDAGYSPHYTETHERLGPMDLSFLPIGAYEPQWFMGPVHMNPFESVQAHLDLRSKMSVGIHFGTFQLTLEGIHEPVQKLDQARQQKGLLETDFFVLPEGQTQVFDLQTSCRVHNKESESELFRHVGGTRD